MRGFRRRDRRGEPPPRPAPRVRELSAREIRLERALRLSRRTIVQQAEADSAAIQVIDSALRDEI